MFSLLFFFLICSLVSLLPLACPLLREGRVAQLSRPGWAVVIITCGASPAAVMAGVAARHNHYADNAVDPTIVRWLLLTLGVR